MFNIKGNDYRLIVKVIYLRKALYVKFIGTHQQYDVIDADTVELFWEALWTSNRLEQKKNIVRHWEWSARILMMNQHLEPQKGIF